MEIILTFFSKFFTFICYLIVIILAVFLGAKFRIKKDNSNKQKGNM